MNLTKQDIKNIMISYCEGRTAYRVLEDRITDYLEGKKLDNIKLKTNMICNDLRGAKVLFDKGQISEGIKQYEFVKNYLFNY